MLAWTLGFGLLGFAPGFAGLSYPLSIVLGVLLGVVGSLMAANRVAGAAREPYAADVPLRLGVGTTLSLFLLVVLTALLHGVRVGFCDPWSDGLRWLLGPAVGAVVAGVWGAIVGVGCESRHWRWAWAVGLPLFSYGASFARFYTSPMVFAFDHFVGYFAGTLYDTELGSLERLWTYRLGTAGFIGCGVWWLLSVGRRREGKGFEFKWRSLRTVWGAAAALLAFVMTWRGPSFGHYQTTSSIEKILHHHVESERCSVQFGQGVSQEAATLLARECSVHVAELERYFDVRGPDRTRVYLFASADQKAWLMGARHVYIAKPWREEVYIQASGFPHPVLRHELAHVVLAAVGRGPFDIAGGLWGLSPDPGRIEGFAVAAAPAEDESLTTVQWAAAMKHLGLLPQLEHLFQLGFFGTNSSTAYTVAGAFVTWLRQTFGVDALKRWYGGDSLEGATGQSLNALQQRFFVSLESVHLTDKDLAAARGRFDRPSVLARKCPYQVDAALTEGLGLVAVGECKDARDLLTKTLDMDSTAFRAEFGLGQCSQLEGGVEAAKTRYRQVASHRAAPSVFQAVAWERLGDLEWQNGEPGPARKHYTLAQSLLIEEERLRQLDVKLAGLDATDELEQRAIMSVFFGEQGKGPLPIQTGFALGRWVQVSGAPLGWYLLGKQFWAIGEWRRAQESLQRALQGESALPPRVRREALRGVLVAACAQGNSGEVAQTAAVLRVDSTASEAALAAWHAVATRCGVTFSR